jgi:hypothetical protein
LNVRSSLQDILTPGVWGAAETFITTRAREAKTAKRIENIVARSMFQGIKRGECIWENEKGGIQRRSKRCRRSPAKYLEFIAKSRAFLETRSRRSLRMCMTTIMISTVARIIDRWIRHGQYVMWHFWEPEFMSPAAADKWWEHQLFRADRPK